MKWWICPILLTVLVTPATAVESDTNWPQFRGPRFNGFSAQSDLPVEWSQTENIRWKADLPGASAAAPIVYGDHVFISSVDVQNESLKAMAFDRTSGKLLWQHEVAKGISQDSRSNYASPTPATDGERVVFFFGTGDLVAYDFAGKQLWARNIQEDYGKFAFLWTFSTSPLLYDGKLYLQVLQRDTAVQGRGFEDRENLSYLLALDPATGKELWKSVRPSKAQAESREAFTTPVPWMHQGHEELLVAGGDAISGHDPDTGKELWRWGTWNPQRIGHWRLVPSPVAGDDVVLVCAPKREPVYAVAPDKHGTLDDSSIAWTSSDEREVSSDVPTPAYADGSFYVLSDVRKSISRVDAKTGKILWTTRTPGNAKYEASPTVADGKIYIVNFVGEVVVINAEDGEVLNTVVMDEPSDDAVRAPVIVAGGNLFIRTNRKLYCVGE